MLAKKAHLDMIRKVVIHSMACIHAAYQRTQSTTMSDELTEVTEAQLPANIKSLWLKAQSAFELKNYTYSVSLCHAVLKESPGFLDARRLARNAAASENAGKKKKKGLFGGSGLSLMKIPSLGKKDPMAAMMALEVELAKSPFDGQANDLLFDNALRMNLLDTAAFALETVRSGSPENTKLLHKLAEHYLARDMPDKAADVYNDIVKQDSSDIDAVKGSKDATARASMKKQKWEEAQSFRDVMKSTDDAAEQEASNRAAMTREQLMEKLEKLSVADTLRAIRFAEVVVLMIDATIPFEKQDLHIADLVEQEGRGLVVAVNKWDLIEDGQAVMADLTEKLGRLLPQIRGVPIITFSALAGKGTDKLMPRIEEVHTVWNSRVSTGKLNRWLEGAVGRHPPPAASGRRVSLKYITQVKSRPPTFAIFSSRAEEVPPSYKRYLINSMRKTFGLPGVPIRIFMRKTKNPYANRARKR